MFTKMERFPGESFYTPVPTHWLRDPRIRGLDKAILGFLQTHAVGYRVTVEQVIAEMYESRDAIYAAVKRLVEHEYLVRAQARGGGGAQSRGGSTKFGQVDYTFGRAAFEQTYERNWGPPEDVAAGGTASGFPVSGSAVTGSAVTGKPDTKYDQGLTDQGLEDQTPPVPPARPARARRAPAPRTGGDDHPPQPKPPPPDPDPDPLAAAAAAVAERRAWSPRVVGEVMAEMVEAGRPVDRVIAVMDRVAADPESQGPGRLRVVPDGWWHDPRRPTSPTPPHPPWCGHCDEVTRTVQVTPPEAGLRTSNGLVARCPACHRQAHLVGAG